MRLYDASTTCDGSNMRFSRRREIWLAELFRALGWLSHFHFLKQPSAAHDCNGLNTDAER
ncbi:MAG: hypothetical protein WCO86_03155 [Planctomycetota bacterium]|jgi:hypothetical protein